MIKQVFDSTKLSYLYERECYVFNESLERFKTAKIVENKINEGDLGESEESVDFFAVYTSKEGNTFVDMLKTVNRDLVFEDVTETGSGFYNIDNLLHHYHEVLDDAYQGIMVIITVCSSYLMDKSESVMHCEYHHFVDNELDKFLNSHPNMSGFFARHSICIESFAHLVEKLEDVREKGIISDYSYDLYWKYLGEVGIKSE